MSSKRNSPDKDLAGNIFRAPFVANYNPKLTSFLIPVFELVICPAIA
jgi:hypothetical protein